MQILHPAGEHVSAGFSLHNRMHCVAQLFSLLEQVIYSSVTSAPFSERLERGAGIARNLRSTLFDQPPLDNLDLIFLVFGRELLNHFERLLKWSSQDRRFHRFPFPFQFAAVPLHLCHSKYTSRSRQCQTHWRQNKHRHDERINAADFPRQRRCTKTHKPVGCAACAGLSATFPGLVGRATR